MAARAGEEVFVAGRLAADADLPARVACFHTHLTAEKALRALQIQRGVLVRKVHNLTRIVDELPASDVERFDHGEDGRYPADHEDVSHETAVGVLDAAWGGLAAVKDAW